MREDRDLSAEEPTEARDFFVNLRDIRAAVRRTGWTGRGPWKLPCALLSSSIITDIAQLAIPYPDDGCAKAIATWGCNRADAPHHRIHT